MGKNTYHIHSNRRPLNQTLETIPVPTIYKASDYGVFGPLTGQGVKIAILDSGVPDHPDILNIGDSIDMSETDRDKIDHHGHSTMISGILTSNNPRSIIGIAPSTELLYAKVINTDGECSYNALIAAILWAVVKQVDIILISLGSQTDYSILHDAIKKAYNSGICVLAAAGNVSGVNEYPSSYPEVLSVGRNNTSKSGKFKVASSTGISIVLPSFDLFTTHLHAKYTKASGTSLSTAIGAGLSSLIIEKAKNKDGKKPTPNHVYSEMSYLAYKPLNQTYKKLIV